MAKSVIIEQNLIIKQIQKLQAAMMKEFADLQASVNTLTGVVDKVVAKVSELEQEILNNALNPADVKAVTDAVNAQIARLQTAASGIMLVGVGLSSI